MMTLGGGGGMIVVLHLVDVNALFVEKAPPKMFCVKVAKYETKKSQLVAQHCFVASFGSMFHVFYFLLSTCCGLKKCSALIGLFALCGSKMVAFVA